LLSGKVSLLKVIGFASIAIALTPFLDNLFEALASRAPHSINSFTFKISIQLKKKKNQEFVLIFFLIILL
jgi:hypothetical protein